MVWKQRSFGSHTSDSLDWGNKHHMAIQLHSNKKWRSYHPSCSIDSYRKTPIMSTNETSHPIVVYAWWQGRKQTCSPPFPKFEILMTLGRKLSNGNKTFLTFHWILIGSSRDLDILVDEIIPIWLGSKILKKNNIHNQGPNSSLPNRSWPPSKKNTQFAPVWWSPIESCDACGEVVLIPWKSTTILKVPFGRW